MTDIQRNQANLQQLYDRVMNEHDVDAADELITPDRPDHDGTFPPEFTRDREGTIPIRADSPAKGSFASTGASAMMRQLGVAA